MKKDSFGIDFPGRPTSSRRFQVPFLPAKRLFSNCSRAEPVRLGVISLHNCYVYLFVTGVSAKMPAGQSPSMVIDMAGMRRMMSSAFLSLSRITDLF
jgi:hypothetical protein